MERLALIGSFFFTLLIATQGSITSATVLARKGHEPKFGALAGGLLALLSGVVAALAAAQMGFGGWPIVLAGGLGSLGALTALWRLTPDLAQQGHALPTGEHMQRNLAARKVRSAIMRWLFAASIGVALLALTVLFWTIINKTVGLVAVQYSVPPTELLLNGAPCGHELDELPNEALVDVLAENVRVARLRVHLLADIAQAAQNQWAQLSPQAVSEVLQGKKYPPSLANVPINKLDANQTAALLVENLPRAQIEKILFDEVVQPEVVSSWTLWESIAHREKIEAEATATYPNANVVWRSWLNKDFLTGQLDPRKADVTGVRPAVKGSLMLIAITILFALPIGVGAAIYLEEYATDTWYNRIIQVNINNLAGVPSIIYGILGLAIFVRFLEHITSGQAFGFNTANGRTVLSGGFTLALLILPLIIINAQEAIRAVPNSLRQASYGLGATQWQTIWHHVLPYALPGILTGTILAISRAIGETAPLILVGGATYLTQDPDGPFSIFTALPLLIYRWTTLPQAEFRNAAAAAIVVLLIMLLTLNSIAVLLRNRFSRRLA